MNNRIAPIGGTSWVMLGLIAVVVAFSIAIVAMAPSSDAALRYLTISEGTLTPSFSPETTAYTATVANTVDSIDVAASPRDAGATLVIDGTFAESGQAVPVALNVGANEITVVVVAEDAGTQTYTITVTREP